MDYHVRGIEHFVNEASDLDELRSSLRTKLETIHQHLEEERRSELERNHRAQEEIENLTSKLESMKQNLISLRKRIEKERKLALHDALTGLFNRLSYDERITQEIARWKRYQRPLSLAVLDVDNFKKINDTYGIRRVTRESIKNPGVSHVSIGSRCTQIFDNLMKTWRGHRAHNTPPPGF